LLYWLQKPVTVVGDTDSPTHLSQLVCGEIKRFQQEFDDLCLPSTWTDVLIFAQTIGDEQLYTAIHSIVFLALHHAAQFDMRIARRLGRWPFKLLLIAEAAAVEPCRLRQDVAGELISSDINTLEANALKIRCLFFEELSIAAKTGTLCPTVLSFLRGIRYHWTCTTQDIEGRNSLVTIMADRCPNASLDLVSERLKIKTALGLGFRGASTSWTSVKPKADELVAIGAQHCHVATDIIGEDQRWVAPTAPAMPAQLDTLRLVRKRMRCQSNTATAIQSQQPRRD
jgi:hypothetical protein